MKPLPERIIHLFETLHPLDRVARAGYVLRGVAEPESVAAHSHFLAVLTLLFAKEHAEYFDVAKALAMALVHDLPESKLMDIPMPSADAHLGEEKEKAEQAIMDELFEDFSNDYSGYHREFVEARTPEAKLVRALDKAQMMLKILMYEREGRGRLGEFWTNPKNFADYGVKPVSDLFDAICGAAGRDRPR